MQAGWGAGQAEHWKKGDCVYFVTTGICMYTASDCKKRHRPIVKGIDLSGEQCRIPNCAALDCPNVHFNSYNPMWADFIKRKKIPIPKPEAITSDNMRSSWSLVSNHPDQPLELSFPEDGPFLEHPCAFSMSSDSNLEAVSQNLALACRDLLHFVDQTFGQNARLPFRIEFASSSHNPESWILKLKIPTELWMDHLMKNKKQVNLLPVRELVKRELEKTALSPSMPEIPTDEPTKPLTKAPFTCCPDSLVAQTLTSQKKCRIPLWNELVIYPPTEILPPTLRPEKLAVLESASIHGSMQSYSKYESTSITHTFHKMIMTARGNNTSDMMVLPAPPYHLNSRDLALSQRNWELLLKLCRYIYSIAQQFPIELAYNFGTWDSRLFDDDGALESHGHTHVILNRNLVEALIARDESRFAPLKGRIQPPADYRRKDAETLMNLVSFHSTVTLASEVQTIKNEIANLKQDVSSQLETIRSDLDTLLRLSSKVNYTNGTNTN